MVLARTTLALSHQSAITHTITHTLSLSHTWQSSRKATVVTASTSSCGAPWASSNTPRRAACMKRLCLETFSPSSCQVTSCVPSVSNQSHPSLTHVRGWGGTSGDSFGEAALLSDAPRYVTCMHLPLMELGSLWLLAARSNATVAALGDTELMVVDKADFEAFIAVRRASCIAVSTYYAVAPSNEHVMCHQAENHHVAWRPKLLDAKLTDPKSLDPGMLSRKHTHHTCVVLPSRLSHHQAVSSLPPPRWLHPRPRCPSQRLRRTT